MEKACVHIYTGEGKGKTTCAAGLAARAVGHGLRVAFIQFMKNGLSGEALALKRLGAEVLCPQSGRFVWEMDEPEKAACAEKQRQTLHRAVAMAQAYDLMVLDEVICALAADMLTRQALETFIAERPSQLELVLTGRGADEALCALADYVTDMRQTAHPFGKGLAARKGIEY